MPNVLMPSLVRALDSSGWGSLRFNYRGVGRSQRGPASELAELDDVRGAISFARTAVPVGATAVIGWSSGSTIALWACAGDTEVDSFIGLSPPVSAAGAGIPALPSAGMFDDWTTPTLLVRGADDAACGADEMALLAKMLGGDVETIEGADHAFNGRLAEMSALVTWFLR